MKKKTGFIIIGVLCVILAAFLIYRLQTAGNGTDAPIRSSSFKLNTVVEITIYDSNDEELLEEALALCDHYEKLFSRTMEDSELYRLNHRTLLKYGSGYTVSEDTAKLIAKGLKYGKLSNGAFDITVEPISSLWNFNSEEKVIPPQEQINKFQPYIGWQKVHIQKDVVTFDDENTRLDLGAIAKGYIADRIKDLLVSKGVKSATINLGGNVLCIGSKPDGSPFKIGIQKPFADRSETIAVIDVTDRSVVSSGIYERFFEKDGSLYHHILNPQTGYPYENELIAVSIICDQSVDGDGLSTTCFALGLDKGLSLVNSLPNVQALFITDDYQVHYSKDFEKEISIEQVS